MKQIDDQHRLWYDGTFETPKDWRDGRVLLHFAAVDWESTVWVNGKELGTHRGGYDGFTYDITDALSAEGKQKITVAVWDPTDKSFQPRGKQVQKPESIWYTPTSGIWQTVWIEPVPRAWVDSVKLTPDVDGGKLRLSASVRKATQGGEKQSIEAVAYDGDKEVARSKGPADDEIELTLKDAKLWTPENPYLYDLKITLSGGGLSDDTVQSYFGMRKSSLGKDKKGVTRMMLNNKPVFQFGPLDQGFWPDGLYTAPTDEALRYDIEMTKKLGFNMARKHVKVEPDRWYYWCDKLGLLVWQDMPSGDKSVAPGKGQIERSEASAKQFEDELKRLIDSHYSHPSIVMWVPFNEGWGQYDTARIVKWVKEHDPSRLVNCASGWNDYPVGDVHDIHSYPGPSSPQPEESRAAVLGEFGGLGLPLSGHTWQSKKNWGYRSYTDREQLTQAFLDLLSKLHPMIGSPGLSAAVYTQTTDVEIEVNGLMTYDRAMIKPDAEKISAAIRRMYSPPPIAKTLVPTSQNSAVLWRYVTDQPPANWAAADFDDSTWKEGRPGLEPKAHPERSCARRGRPMTFGSGEQ